jgi:hypothetical protein
VAEDEDMVCVEHELVFAETEENEAPMLGPLRDESETEEVAVQ